LRKQFLEIQIKDNPFIKCTPTEKYYNLLEQTNNFVKIRVVARAKDVPLSDCFLIEEEMICAMPSKCVSSSILRVSTKVIMIKSTIMKSIIISNSNKETKVMWQ
jgi:hypothetical protein